ncbi:putative Ig domain-containing protein [Rathayibacter sp. Leaf296]|uniref:putative Ig domain-containing protein n=1 Tax=Rathayibacter sp. Leaf296 TaxID=1736327 RepID=UPI0007024F90|nr:putative Ig domain-containing protein [Rathayibacter sp. Leaf296]KQQ10878.1 hypothetical protein ASF46_07790 [Rathayibacter sp. Leaf296]
MAPNGVAGWGKNLDGQSVAPAGLTDVIAVSAAPDWSLALRGDGTVTAWGYNGTGQLNVPAGLTGVTAIAAGLYHGLALKSDGTVVAWGDSTFGQATAPAGLAGVTAIAAGRYFSLALKNDGTVVGWGTDTAGQLDIPADLTGVTAIAAGSGHALALTSAGTVTAWGDSRFGQATVPTGLTGVTAIAAGSAHSLAVTAGTVTAWGSNASGQTSVPAGLAGVTAVAAGGADSLALRSDGTVAAWGDNRFGQAVVPTGIAGVTAISSSESHDLAVGPRPVLTSDAPPTTATVGTSVSYSFAANTATTTFAVASGSLPDGLTLTPDGVLSGTPATPEDATFTVAARNPFGATEGASHTITVETAATAPTVSGDPGPGTVGTPYDVSYTVTGSPAPQLSVLSGRLPAGLSLDTAGRLTGTPTTAGTYAFTVRAENASGVADTTSTITIAAAQVAPTLSGTAADGVVGTAYDFGYTVTGTPTPAVSVTVGILPPGLALSAAGRLTGSPTTAGTYGFTVSAVNAAGSVQVDESITIASADVAPAVSGDSANGTVGSSYDYAYTVTGTPSPTVSVTAGALPPGLSLSAAGHLIGTPTTAGTYGFTVSAVSSAGTAQVVDSITISAAAVAPTVSGVVAAGMVGSAYDYSYTVTGSPTPTVSVISGTLPPGLTLSASGRLTGTPTVAGTSTFTVRAENSAGVARATSTLTVSPRKVTAKADLRVDLLGPSSAVKGRTFTYTLTTTNAGPATSTSVYSEVFLPSNVQFVSATGTYTRIGNVVVFQRSSLTDGQSISARITVKATGTGRSAALATTFSTRTPDPSVRSNAEAVRTTIR